MRLVFRLFARAHSAPFAVQMCLGLVWMDDGFLNIFRGNVHHMGLVVIEPDGGMEMGHAMSP